MNLFLFIVFGIGIGIIFLTLFVIEYIGCSTDISSIQSFGYTITPLVEVSCK
jgi:hypothetical protein